MTIYLVQHGKNLSKDIDPEQHLSAEGIDTVKRVAQTAKTYNVIIGSIEHSSKTRARQTAELFAEALGVENVSAADGLKALDDVTRKADSITDGHKVMLVGHLPFMERMASYLTTGSTDHTVFKFQNGGIVCLDQLPNSRHWAIKWALMPEIG